MRQLLAQLPDIAVAVGLVDLALFDLILRFVVSRRRCSNVSSGVATRRSYFFSFLTLPTRVLLPYPSSL